MYIIHWIRAYILRVWSILIRFFDLLQKNWPIPEVPIISSSNGPNVSSSPFTITYWHNMGDYFSESRNRVSDIYTHLKYLVKVVEFKPSEKWWSESQLGWSNSQYDGKNNPFMFQTTTGWSQTLFFSVKPSRSPFSLPPALSKNHEKSLPRTAHRFGP